jgi:2-hydroxy-3-keto-5-methylthiopentenyl-1-phosphate phosphatase
MKEYRHRLGHDCRVVFVGDGYSDACGADEADLVLAKKDLIRYCEDKGISYNSYRSFDDVTSLLLRQGILVL